jgi:hypothetical protein
VPFTYMGTKAYLDVFVPKASKGDGLVDVTRSLPQH